MFKQAFKNNQVPLNGLQQIRKQLNQQEQLLRVIQSALPDNLATHCLHTTYSKNNVILFTDSSVWASKLLYMRQAILNALSQHVGERVHALKVNILSKHVTRHQKAPKTPSNKTISFLSEANNIESSDKLSISMNKLIKTLKKNNLLN
ncbi:MAG: DciA family protein [Cycloclasticus sp.]